MRGAFIAAIWFGAAVVLTNMIADNLRTWHMSQRAGASTGFADPYRSATAQPTAGSPARRPSLAAE